MATNKIQTGDNVKIIAGSYKGTIGVVSATYTKKKKNGTVQRRVVVSGVPLHTAYQRSLKAAGLAGQMYTKERSVDVSNVQVVDGAGKVAKVKIEKSGKTKQRLYKTTGKAVEKVKAEKKKDDKKEDKKSKAKKK